MSKYMYLFRGGDKRMAELSPEESQAHMGEWKTWMENLGKSGNFIDGLPLAREGWQLTAAESVPTDGPFTEGKEIVGGYLIVTADTPEGAIEMARGCPIFKTGGQVEVREVISMDGHAAE